MPPVNTNISEEGIDLVPKKFMEFWENHKKIKNLDHFKWPETQHVPRKVCAKVITPRDRSKDFILHSC